MTLALFLLFAVPIGLAVGSVAGRLGELESGQLNNITVPPPPAWVQKVPMVGTKIETAWREVSSGQVDLSTKIQPYLQPMIAWLGRKAGSFLALVVQLIVIVIAAGILYANGEIAATGVRRFAERLAGERGDRVIVLAGQAIRGVALGVVVTAILQTALERARAVALRYSTGGVSHGRHLPVLCCTDWPCAGHVSGGRLDVLQRLIGEGHPVSSLDPGLRHHGQHPAAHPHQAGSRPASPAGLPGCDRWIDWFRTDWDLRRARWYSRLPTLCSCGG